MSQLEILLRANYLIYMYIKKTLKNDELAKSFLKVVQENCKEEFIYFKGLEDLTLLLKKYYSSQTKTSGQDNGVASHVPEDRRAINGKTQVADADFVVETDKKSEKSKKKRSKHPKSKEMFGQETKAESEVHVPDIEESNDAVQVQQEKMVSNSVRTEKKNSTKKQHSELIAEAEGGVQPGEIAPPNVNGSEEVAAPAATEEGESEKAPKKKRKKKRHLEAEGEAECGVEETPEGAPHVANSSAGLAAAEEGESEVAPKKRRKKQKAAADVESSDKLGDACCVPKANEEAEQHPSADVDLDASADFGASGGNVKPAANQQKRHNQPFRRVREEEVVNKHFHDNSFDAKPGSSTGWGYKANEDLRPTQGRSFRHEKTKKKRGSYKGGSIDTGVSSFKFDSDSE